MARNIRNEEAKYAGRRNLRILNLDATIIFSTNKNADFKAVNRRHLARNIISNSGKICQSSRKSIG